MARLNTRVASTPAQGPSNVFPESPSSDKENEPALAPRDKGKGRMPPHGKLPTPNSDSTSERRGTKRRRLSVRADEEPEADAPQDSDDEEERYFDAPELKYYDPGQDPGERQEVKRKSRALEREFNENRDAYLRTDNDGLQHTISRANKIFEDVKQTADATLDSRLIVNVADLAYKKSAHMVLGDASVGLDVDEFVSRCIAFMRDDNSTTATQRRRRAQVAQQEDDDDEEEEEAEEVLDWARFGAEACFPHNSRPPVPSFLLGPLSVQKRARAPTQRRARQQRDTNNAHEVRPETLTKEDLASSESNTLTLICSQIRQTLSEHCERAEAGLDAAGGDVDDDFMRKYRVGETGGPSLFEFVVNPRSFSQTVENIFYVSFLIKEGNVGVTMDGEGLPTLLPAQSGSVGDKRDAGATRHQAVFSIDYATWQQLIRAFDIREPLIGHRVEASTQVGSRGWYQ